MSYFTSQKVGNPVQVIKYVDLSKFQPILKLLLEIYSLLSCFLVIFANSDCDKMRALSIFQIIDYQLNIDYVVLVCAETDN